MVGSSQPVGMAQIDYRGSQPASRVKVLVDGTLEDDVAGQSDGQSAGTITVGWGGMVRRARSRHSHRPPP